jgi:hypothetical protein
MTCIYREAILRVVERDRLELSLIEFRFFCLIDLVAKLLFKGVWGSASPSIEGLK